MYAIFRNDVPVGKAEVKKEGLYYRFTCSCTPPEAGIYRISVSDGNTVRDLGICVPTGAKFTLNARLPAKYLREDKLTFFLISNEERGTESGFPIATGKPFEHLDKLNAARLQMRNGQPVIVIDSAQVPRGSDQSQRPENKSEQQ